MTLRGENEAKWAHQMRLDIKINLYFTGVYIVQRFLIFPPPKPLIFFPKLYI